MNLGQKVKGQKVMGQLLGCTLGVDLHLSTCVGANVDKNCRWLSADVNQS